MLKTKLYSSVLIILSVILLANNDAKADITLSLSAGTGWQSDGPSGRLPTNLMLAPGVEIIDDFLRFELGLVTDFGDVETREFDIQLRPMMVVEIPGLPIYGRLNIGVTRLAHGPVGFAFGGALGLKISIGNLSLFAEAGYVPEVADDNFISIFEGRAGVGVNF